MKERMYLCIDLKSFYASTECVVRGLDPMTTNLVVADPERGPGTICLAVSPSMKALGVKNRCRVYEIPPHMPYIKAAPRMKLYLDYSAKIYGIYLKYISKDDIHVYSVDEAFLDVTDYLTLYRCSAKEVGIRILREIKDKYGLIATCGIGTNLYLTKIALDITAKHASDRIGYLDEELYCRTLWRHLPLTDFWQIGHGLERRLNSVGLVTMEDIAQAPEPLMYRMFGVNAEYMIDHAWGREPTTIADIKAYKTADHSLSQGQVLFHDYTFEEAIIIVKEMADLLSLDMVDKHLVTNSLSLYIGYSNDSMPPARGTTTMTVTTNSSRIIIPHFVKLYESCVNRFLPIRRVSLCCNHVVDELYEQYDLFTDCRQLEKDRNLQLAILQIKDRYGKNAILRGIDFVQSATTRDRNMQIGGHKSG